jgi:hypothetical protein
LLQQSDDCPIFTFFVDNAVLKKLHENSATAALFSSLLLMLTTSCELSFSFDQLNWHSNAMHAGMKEVALVVVVAAAV